MSWFEFVTCDLLKIENNEIKYEDGNIVKLLFFSLLLWISLFLYELKCGTDEKREFLRFVIC